jgi:hypothetical protein
MRYNVSADLLIPVLVEIEADSEEDAIDKLHEMDRGELFKLANTEPSGIDILEGSETADEGVQ